jgi:hypothetical protein
MAAAASPVRVFPLKLAIRGSYTMTLCPPDALIARGQPVSELSARTRAGSEARARSNRVSRGAGRHRRAAKRMRFMFSPVCRQAG